MWVTPKLIPSKKPPQGIFIRLVSVWPDGVFSESGGPVLGDLFLEVGQGPDYVVVAGTAGTVL